jgi:RHS repeat-associated protein
VRRGYSYGFNGKENDSDGEWGRGILQDFGARIYSGAVGRWLSVDPKATLLTSSSPYVFCLNSPLSLTDPDGKFPILINGLSDRDGRGNRKYWGDQILSTITAKTGYKESQMKFVNGDHYWFPSSRKTSGTHLGKQDAWLIYLKLKESMNEKGQITEQLQFITHSRGGAFANGYMQGLTKEIKRLAKEDGQGVTFAYGENNIIEYSVNLAPHQSNYIHYENGSRVNVNISHRADPLSGNDATGDVINVHSVPNSRETSMNPLSHHSHESHIPELSFVLDILEQHSSQSSWYIYGKIESAYKKFDKEQNNWSAPSSVTHSTNH